MAKSTPEPLLPVVTLRRASLADLPVLMTQRRAMFNEMKITTPRRVAASLRPFEQWLHPLLRSGRCRAWLVESEGKPVAGATAWIPDWPPNPRDRTDRAGYVMNVYTDPGFRGRGLATRLVQTCMDWLRSRGIRRVTLHASVQGRPIYERMGFKTTNEMRVFLPASHRPIRSRSSKS